MQYADLRFFKYINAFFGFNQLMQKLAISYAKAFNRWHNSVGHVFQGNYQIHLVDSDEYLSHLCRYIHLNPVKSKLVMCPEQWQFSDYSLWIDENSSKETPSTRLRDNLFGNAQIYKQFVIDYQLDIQKQDELLKKFGFPNSYL